MDDEDDAFAAAADAPPSPVKKDGADSKDRHSSGDSMDSVLAPPTIVEDISGTPAGGLHGILKPRRSHRCFSESQTDLLSWASEASSCVSSITEEDGSAAGSKKSVHFNEVVQRQVFRPNASILGQKTKNQKKNEQKKRRAEQKRRASEGDAEDSRKVNKEATGAEETEEEEEHHNDSGVASSVDEAGDSAAMDKFKAKRNSGRKARKNSGSVGNSSHDLIFELDH